MSRLFLTCVLSLVSLTPGCFISRVTVNTPLRHAELAGFEPGKTTAKEVVDKLGAPNEVVQLGTRSAYRYDFSVLKRGGFSIIVLTFVNDDTHTDRVWLFFDSKDVLTHSGATLQSQYAEYAMPWQDLEGH